MWFVAKDGKLWVSTLANAFKLRRLRHTPRVRFAPCDSSGRRILGEWEEGSAPTASGFRQFLTAIQNQTQFPHVPAKLKGVTLSVTP